VPTAKEVRHGDERPTRQPPGQGAGPVDPHRRRQPTALVPFRDELQQGAAVILILPVVAVALAAGARPAVVAALSAGTSFGVLLTQPYGQFAIHQGTDVIATVVLLPGPSCAATSSST
jgi:hypothetical protein